MKLLLKILLIILLIITLFFSIIVYIFNHSSINKSKEPFTGYLYDIKTNTPITHVKIELQGYDFAVFSDSLGYFSIPFNDKLHDEGKIILVCEHYQNDTIFLYQRSMDNNFYRCLNGEVTYLKSK